MIVAQEPAEPRPTADRGVREARRFANNQSVMQTFVVPLVVIVRGERAERPAQMRFPENDDPVETFFLDQWPRPANRRRCASVKRTRRPPNCSLRTRFSSRR